MPSVANIHRTRMKTEISSQTGQKEWSQRISCAVVSGVSLEPQTSTRSRFRLWGTSPSSQPLFLLCGLFLSWFIVKPDISPTADRYIVRFLYVRLFKNTFLNKSRAHFNSPIKPGSQSCAVAKGRNFWRATGQSDLVHKRLTAPKASKVWFSSSHNCTLSSGAVFHSVCQICLSSGPPEYSTFTYCACLWNWLIHPLW